VFAFVYHPLQSGYVRRINPAVADDALPRDAGSCYTYSSSSRLRWLLPY
jgi:hypothetical protein